MHAHVVQSVLLSFNDGHNVNHTSCDLEQPITALASSLHAIGGKSCRNFHMIALLLLFLCSFCALKQRLGDRAWYMMRPGRVLVTDVESVNICNAACD